MVHELIDAYKLTKTMDVVTAMPATEDELRLFHSAYYLDYLKVNCNDESGIQLSDATANADDADTTDSDDSNVDDEQLEYGLGGYHHKFSRRIIAFYESILILFSLNTRH